MKTKQQVTSATRERQVKGCRASGWQSRGLQVWQRQDAIVRGEKVCLHRHLLVPELNKFRFQMDAYKL